MGFRKERPPPTSADITYITDQLIAMSMPGDASNPMDALATFLQENHQGKFMVWNLSEESYEYSVFENQVMELKCPGQPSPPITMLCNTCTLMESWLEADSDNIAIVHCKTGKGRTNIMLACFLAWTGRCTSTITALEYMGKMRGGHDLTRMFIPSPARYLTYFDRLITRDMPSSQPVLLRRIIVNTIPKVPTSFCHSTTRSWLIPPPLPPPPSLPPSAQVRRAQDREACGREGRERRGRVAGDHPQRGRLPALPADVPEQQARLQQRLG
jgi:hypothetical protein